MRTTLPYYTSVVLLASLLVSSAQAQHDETSSTLLRRNRKVLDVNQWLEDHPVIDEKTPPQVHTQAATAASTSASAPCNGVLCDLFDETSRHLLGSMSMSLSMSYPSAPTSPTTPTSPSVPTAPTVPTTPTVPTPSAPSASIVPAPTSSEECTSLTRMDAFVQQLQVYTDISLLLNPVTPQGMALMWLVNTDTTTDPCMTPNLAQRYGLVVLYYSTDGATSWSNSEGWLTASTSECTWFGVTCDGSTAGVTAVVLPGNNLSGSLPDEVKAIATLQTLDLFNNALTGPIPPEAFSALSSLKILDVEQNSLVGPAFVLIPLSLESYRVSFNQLTGAIPDITELASLNLKEFWAAQNLITGTIPSIVGSMTTLESIFLYENQIGGVLPDFSNLDLVRLQLQNNTLTGTIPDSLWTNTRLLDVRLDGNQLMGTISTSIGDMAELFDLRLSTNALTGTIPAELAKLSTLRFLRMNENSLSGTIRDAFDAFSVLEFADFSKNMLTGTLPRSIFDVPTLEILYLYENALTGTIPDNFAASPVLRDLYINDNVLSGVVPAVTPDALPVFTEFRLENNNIIGSMPASICALRGTNNDTDLVTLSADCAGAAPQIACSCCTMCA